MSVPGVAPLTEQLVVQPDASKVVIDVGVEGLGRRTGARAHRRPTGCWYATFPIETLLGKTVQLRLSDRFGNALPDRSVRLAVLQDGRMPASDAGPR